MNTAAFGALATALAGGAPRALAVVVTTSGSTPARAGRRALISPDGRILGSVGGGAMEAAVQREAIAALANGRPSLVEVRMHGEGGGVPEPICGGRMLFLVDPRPAGQVDAYRQAARAQGERRRGRLLTEWQAGRAPFIRARWIDEGRLEEGPGWMSPPDWAAAMNSAEPSWVQVGDPGVASGAPSAACLIEPVGPPPFLTIFGAGHVGRAVSWQAHQMGFEVAVVDEREEWLEPGAFPAGVRLLAGSPVQAASQLPMDADTYIVLVGPGYPQDLEALAVCLTRPVRYVGMIGSRRKVSLVRRDLLLSGRASAADWARVHAPIGLDLGAVEVPEIALSIVAELVAVRRGRRARPADP